MRRHRGTRSAQRGVALIVMMTIIALGASWMMVSALNAASNRTAPNRNDNARALAEAKAALIGWMMIQAIESGEDNPGRIPCPETSAGDGIAAGNCTLPAIGRLPWRTLGLPRLLDAAGEPLWYVVSPGWAKPTSTSLLTINSDTLGQLALDGGANAAVALIIAPGPALNVQACGGNPARVQRRGALAPDYRDYLECENAISPAGVSFVTRGPSTSFNDQVLAVTTRDLLPGLEGAIAKRVEREIVPVLRSVYAGSEWGLSANNPMFPYAAPFGNPGTSDYRGVAGWTQGLLPFSYYAVSCPGVPTPSDPPDSRCNTNFVDWATTPWPTLRPTLTQTGGTATLDGYSCTISYPWAYCTGQFTGNTWETLSLRLGNATGLNVAMALRSIDNTQTYVYIDTCPPGGCWQITSAAASASFNTGSVLIYPAGSATITVDGTLTGIGSQTTFYLAANIRMFANHALLDASVSSPTGWFVRNEWYRLMGYAVAPGLVASGTPPRACEATTPTCLSVANVAPTSKQRAILLLAGRSLSSAPRPNANVADYFDSSENTDGDTSFEQLRVGANSNDRLIVVDVNP